MSTRSHPSWLLTEALVFVRALEQHLIANSSGYRVALTGGTLHRGQSDKDVDVVLYPYCTGTQMARRAVRPVLAEFGLSLRIGVRELHAYWRDHGSADEKSVEIYDYRPRGGLIPYGTASYRVDVMWLK